MHDTITLRFENHSDADLCRYWNEGDGSIGWLADLEAELTRRGYFPRATGPEDTRPRLRGECVRLDPR